MGARTVEEIVGRLLEADRRALARSISMVENREPEAEDILRAIYPRTGRAFVLGITGAPGVGKSTLVNELVRGFRQKDLRVGIVAVDPSSPFSGGAILGDRVRMVGGRRDLDVFFRSLGNRGYAGGVSRATQEVIHLLDAAGFDVIILETVGAGQSEVEVMRFAHTVLVVTVPGLGDEVQVAKAGILEIGDVFVVNKADREGADRVAAELQAMLSLLEEEREWDPPVVKTVAHAGEGISQLLDAVERHRQFLEGSELLELRRAELAERQLSSLVSERVLNALQETAAQAWQEAIDAINQRRSTPMQAAEQLLTDEEIMTALVEQLRREAEQRGDAS